MNKSLTIKMSTAPDRVPAVPAKNREAVLAWFRAMHDNGLYFFHRSEDPALVDNFDVNGITEHDSGVHLVFIFEDEEIDRINAALDVAVSLAHPRLLCEYDEHNGLFINALAMIAVTGDVRGTMPEAPKFPLPVGIDPDGAIFAWFCELSNIGLGHHPDDPFFGMHGLEIDDREALYVSENVEACRANTKGDISLLMMMANEYGNGDKPRIMFMQPPAPAGTMEHVVQYRRLLAYLSVEEAGEAHPVIGDVCRYIHTAAESVYENFAFDKETAAAAELLEAGIYAYCRAMYRGDLARALVKAEYRGAVVLADNPDLVVSLEEVM